LAPRKIGGNIETYSKIQTTYIARYDVLNDRTHKTIEIKT